MMLQRILLIGVLALLPGTALSQEAMPGDSAISAMVQDRVTAGWTRGLVVGLLRADGSRQIFASGDGGGGRTLSGESVFEIGSITKAFTGILLAEMAARREVRLDEPVEALLPPGTRMPGRNGRTITLVDLSTQSSGLPRLPGNLNVVNPANPYADYSDSLLFVFLASYTLPRDVGAEYEYSNLGVGLLGNALARRAGTSYESLLRERVLDPLGMQDTRITLTPELSARLAQGHNGEGVPVSLWDLPALAGAGALRSTANDMLTFLAANISGAPGTVGEALLLAQQSRRPAGGAELSIGLGWHILSKNGRSIVWHNGGTGGYRTFAGFDPVRKIGVVVLANTATNNDDIGFHLLDPAAPLDPTRSARTVAVPDSVLTTYVGSYELAPNFTLTITREGGSLFGQATGQSRFQLFPRSGEEFYLKVVEARVVFERGADGQVTGLVLHQGGQRVPGKRLASTPSQ